MPVRALAGGRPANPTVEGGRRPRRAPGSQLAALSQRRRKLLDLYYEDGISKELFAEEEQRLSAEIEAVRAQAGEQERQESLRSELVEAVRAGGCNSPRSRHRGGVGCRK